MRPKQDDIITRAVQGLQGIATKLGETEASKRHVLKAGFNVRGNVIPAWVVVWMPEDLDVRMQSFQGMLRVLDRTGL